MSEDEDGEPTSLRLHHIKKSKKVSQDTSKPTRRRHADGSAAKRTDTYNKLKEWTKEQEEVKRVRSKESSELFIKIRDWSLKNRSHRRKPEEKERKKRMHEGGIGSAFLGASTIAFKSVSNHDTTAALLETLENLGSPVGGEEHRPPATVPTKSTSKNMLDNIFEKMKANNAKPHVEINTTKLAPEENMGFGTAAPGTHLGMEMMPTDQFIPLEVLGDGMDVGEPLEQEERPAAGGGAGAYPPPPHIPQQQQEEALLPFPNKAVPLPPGLQSAQLGFKAPQRPPNLQGPFPSAMDALAAATTASSVPPDGGGGGPSSSTQGAGGNGGDVTTQEQIAKNKQRSKEKKNETHFFSAGNKGALQNIRAPVPSEHASLPPLPTGWQFKLSSKPRKDNQIYYYFVDPKRKVSWHHPTTKKLIPCTTATNKYLKNLVQKNEVEIKQKEEEAQQKMIEHEKKRQEAIENKQAKQKTGQQKPEKEAEKQQITSQPPKVRAVKREKLSKKERKALLKQAKQEAKIDNRIEKAQKKLKEVKKRKGSERTPRKSKSQPVKREKLSSTASSSSANNTAEDTEEEEEVSSSSSSSGSYDDVGTPTTSTEEEVTTTDSSASPSSGSSPTSSAHKKKKKKKKHKLTKSHKRRWASSSSEESSPSLTSDSAGGGSAPTKKRVKVASSSSSSSDSSSSASVQRHKRRKQHSPKSKTKKDRKRRKTEDSPPPYSPPAASKRQAPPDGWSVFEANNSNKTNNNNSTTENIRNKSRSAEREHHKQRPAWMRSSHRESAERYREGGGRGWRGGTRAYNGWRGDGSPERSRAQFRGDRRGRGGYQGRGRGYGGERDRRDSWRGSSRGDEVN